MGSAFSNWSGSHRCEPARRESPGSEAEVQAIVRSARSAKQRIKVVGAGHSFSDVAMTEGVLLSLHRLAGVRAIDGNAGRVTVAAGTRLHDLNVALAEAGFTLPILGSIDVQSLAGLTSTGTHGSSLVHGNLSSLIVGMRLVGGSGEVLVLEERDAWLAGARVGLGALGVVTELTLRIEPMFRLVEETVPMEFEAALAAFPAWGRDHEWAKLWWIPHTDKAQLFRGTRTADAPNWSPTHRWLDAKVLNGWVFPGVLALGNWLPGTIPFLNRAIGRVHFKHRRTVGEPRDVLPLSMPPRHQEAEHAIPVEHCAEAMRRIRALIEEKNLRINFILEARLVRGDENWMSPAYGRDTVQIGTYTTNPADKEAFFSGCAAIFADWGGRPHWGKENALTAEQAAKLYPKYAEFRALARECDPAGTFRNAMLDRLLGD